jgi:hypothetical protein
MEKITKSREKSFEKQNGWLYEWFPPGKNGLKEEKSGNIRDPVIKWRGRVCFHAVLYQMQKFVRR